MQVEQNNKTLYHLQSVMVDYRDYPYDIFVFSEKEPTIEQCKKLYKEDVGFKIGNLEIKDFVENLEINKVCANEI